MIKQIICAVLFTTTAGANGLPPIPIEAARALCTTLEKANAIAKAKNQSEFIELNTDQWQFLRGMSFASDKTGPGIPPGNKALISYAMDRSAIILFRDGPAVCYPMTLIPAAAEILDAVGRGEVVNAWQML